MLYAIPTFDRLQIFNQHERQQSTNWLILGPKSRYQIYPVVSTEVFFRDSHSSLNPNKLLLPMHPK
jgi:hypothetical protein